MHSIASLLAIALALGHASAQVVGSATGFATGVTGGGDATPATPADIDELVEWLTDSTPRVIMLDKTYDFTGSEGETTEDGCRPSSNTCPNNGGQDAINGANWCGSNPVVSVTYDKAAITPIDVASDKSIVGVGDAGVIKGKGLRLTNDVSNIIIQNIHITDLNPQYIWGGDAIQMTGTDMVWIDHCKFSLIGRQFLVTGYEQAGRVTISNNELDGKTSWSASCNGDHYWTMLFLGAADKITFTNNYIHNTSGRSPKIGGSGSITFHAVNNYWSSIGGHAFDVAEGGSVLIEGNVFDSVDTPITAASSKDGGKIFNVPSSSSASSCSSSLGRDCVANVLSNSGDFASYTDSSALSGFSGEKNIVKAVSTNGLADTIVANAGIGKLSSSSASSSAKASAEEVAVSSSAAPVAASTAAPAATSSAVAVESPVASTLATQVKPTSATASPASTGSSSSGSSSSGSIGQWEQCGGQGWTGSGSCASGLTCKEWNEWYAQCL